jgi:hypothetical protein
VATAGAYWAERSRAILDFQLAQPQSCLSLRREDLEADAQEQMRLVWSFLGLTPPRAVIRQRSDPAVTEHGARPRFPVDRLPPRLRTQRTARNARLPAVVAHSIADGPAPRTAAARCADRAKPYLGQVALADRSVRETS